MQSNLPKNKILAFLIYGLIFLPFTTPWYRFLFLLLGLMLGLVLLIIDERVLHHKYNDQLVTDNEDGNSKKSVFLATRSSLFLLVLAPLAIFVVTSTSSAIGIGFVLGLVLGLVHEMWLFRNLTKKFSNRFLSQLKVNSTATLVTKITLGYSLFFFLISLWTLLKR